MNSFLAAALRWIFPLAARGATVDFFLTDAVDFLDADDFDDEDFAEPIFGFDDELFGGDDRVVEDRDEEARPFWASVPMGSSRSAKIRARTNR